MKLITCASYYGSGSSAITDLMSEFKEVESLGSEFECRFIQDPHGISDLEYYLVENNHRHNSGYAIKKFKRLIELGGGNRKIRIEDYGKYLGDKFYDLTEEYINQLISVSYSGGWHYDLYDRGNLEIILFKIKSRIHDLLIKKTKITSLDDSYKGREMSYMDKEIAKQTTYIISPTIQFYDLTKKYIDSVFSTCLRDQSKYLMVDQLVPPSNTKKYLRYFNDLKIICVDRDPRDIYILEKVYWKTRVIPVEVEEFIKWFDATRRHRSMEEDDTSRVLRLKFEDLIYKYDETVDLIIKFMGLKKEDHIRAKEKFNPEISIENTKKWLIHPEFEEDIKKIEERLKAYCYEYED